MPAPTDVDLAATYAGELLGTCLSTLAIIGERPSGYLYPGQPPIDVGEPECQGMVAVYAASIGRTPMQIERGAPAGAMTMEARGPRVPQVAYTVVYARCTPVWGDEVGEVPAPDQLTTEAVLHLRAAWALMNGIVSAVSAGRLFNRCRTFTVSDLTPLAVSGEAAGWSFTVTVQIPGYDPYDFAEQGAAATFVGVADTSPAH